MKQYGTVNFNFGGVESAELQKQLITLLDAHGVISVPEEEIQKWFDEDKKVQWGCTHNYVLHDKNEADIFRTVMESEAMRNDNITWKISRRPNKNMAGWMKEKEAKKHGKCEEM